MMNAAEGAPKMSGRPADSKAQGTAKKPPVSSAKSLPPLGGRIADLLPSRDVKDEPHTTQLEFDVNQECTSLALVPSGRMAVAGFTDGTLRLFDLTGTFVRDKYAPPENDFDDDNSEGSLHFDDEVEHASSSLVNSHTNQQYGAVACQIHARGIHTVAMMDVAVSEDGLYAFGGVQRGSVELAAVYLGDIENYLNEHEDKMQCASASVTTKPSLLDLVEVDRHADAKLKGFGACKRLWNGWERSKNERPEYLLLTGKGIKNIHVWSFKPSCPGKGQQSTWTCIYDCPTNGASIHQLYFRTSNTGMLQSISKSDDQKIRVWDLSYEECRITSGSEDVSDRPKRPPYKDITSTEGTVGVCCHLAFASGEMGGMHNIVNVVGLDAESPYNSSELALPGGAQMLNCRPSRSGRSQRGDLKSVVNVEGLIFDASHALLQISDGSVVHYRHDVSGHPILEQCPSSMFKTSIDDGNTSHSKKVALARVGSEGMALYATSSWSENSGRGAIMLRALPKADEKPRRYWGYFGLKKKRKGSSRDPSAPAVSAVSSSRPSAETATNDHSNVPTAETGKDSQSKVQVPLKEAQPSTQKPPLQQSAGKHQTPATQSRKPSAAMPKNAESNVEVSTTKAQPSTQKLPFDQSSRKHRTPATALVGETPAAVNKITPESSPLDKVSTATSNASTTVKFVKKKKRQAGLDGQLQSIVEGTVKHVVQSPDRSNEDDQPVPLTKKAKVAEISFATRSSPRKRGSRTKKASDPSQESPLEGDTELKDPTPQEGKESEIKVGFVGVTLLDRRPQPSLPEACYQSKERSALLVEQLPPGTVKDRLLSSQKSDDFLLEEGCAVADSQQLRLGEERQALAAKHRAEHEYLRRNVLQSVKFVLSTWDIENSSNRPHESVVEKATAYFDEALAGHQETLSEMIFRQSMEAETLTARQAAESPRQRVPTLQVNFPFPEVFEDARSELIALLK